MPSQSLALGLTLIAAPQLISAALPPGFIRASRSVRKRHPPSRALTEHYSQTLNYYQKSVLVSIISFAVYDTTQFD